MESPTICYSDGRHFKSASFRNNEQFRRTLTEFFNCRSSCLEHITDPYRSSVMDSRFASKFATLREFDRRCLRAEKLPMLRGFIAEVVEVHIHPELSSYLRFLNETLDDIVQDQKWSQELESRIYLPPLSFIAMIRFSRLHDMVIQSFVDIISLILALDQADLELTYNVIVSVVVLSIVYQYLLGYVERGGSKTYNPGSLEFRATYVSLLLFRGAYVWIKFRDVAPRTVYRRSRRDEFGQLQYYGKYEPRFKPPREKGFPMHNYLPLGGYDTEKDAKVVCQIAGFYYEKDEGVVAMEDGSRFSIPEMSEQERSFCGEEKRKRVSEKAKAVFRGFKERAALSANAGEQVDARGFSPPADQAVVAFSTASDDGFAEFLSGLAREHHDPTVQSNPDDLFNLDAGLALSQEALAPALQESLNEQLNPQREQLDDPTMQFNPENLLNSDADLAVFQEALEPTMQERLDEQLLADFNGRLAEEHQKRRRLEEENMELRQEIKRLKTMLQQAATPLRAFLLTSTVELESPIENC